jgi:glucosamine-6-phosphate deaminase
MIKPGNYKIVIEDNYNGLCRFVADAVTQYVRDNPEGVLGMFAGGTSIGLWKLLVKLNASNPPLDFSGITCLCPDERYPVAPDSERSFHYFMRRHFFDHVKVRAWHIPDGRERSPEQIDDDCLAFEELIRDIRKERDGGLQLMGMGSDGHFFYNERGSPVDSRTRFVDLAESTIDDAKSEYAPGEYVRRHGITMGVATALEADQIIQMASNAKKVAKAMRNTLMNAPNENDPSSLLKLHKNMTFCMTRDVAEPWLRLNAQNRILRDHIPSGFIHT